jgi:hypothetical protein
MVEANTFSVAPPWEPQAFFAEDALRAAQEYWFQTHGTHSRLIAEGRSAVGFMKSHLRRKLEREMGEDFKMYTGQAIGESQERAAESAGIRGELNQMLEVVYNKIAHGKPLQSPIQEDLTILSHPLGGLEVCYALVFFYTTLMQRYATLAGNRRKVLKSILDEELFKWVWRTTVALFMSPDPKKIDLSQSMLSTGIRQIPPDRQRATSAEKVLEIGQFMMAKMLSESHLRFPLVFYFNAFCRRIQFSLLSRYTPQQCESIYHNIVARKRGDGVSDVIVAIDELMNTTGNSGQSFEDILKDEDAEVEKYIPPAEIEFISQFREFTRNNLGGSLKRLLPQNRPTAGEGAASLMPVMLILRTLPFYLRKLLLEKIPGPMLNLFLNRLGHGGDDVSSGLATQIRETIQARSKSGETYTLIRQDARRTPIAGASPASTRPAQPAPSESASPEARSASAAGAELKEESAPVGATPGIGRLPGATGAAAPAPPRPGGTAGSEAAEEPFDQPVIVDWRIDAGELAVETITARDLMQLAGPEARLFFQLVKFALQTGQVFRVAPEKVSKELMEGLIVRLIKQGSSGPEPLLSKEERLALLEAGKNLSAKQVLAALVKRIQRPARPAGTLQQIAASLSGKLGGRLEAFLSNPGQEGFRDVVQNLNSEERSAVNVLTRVARVS